MESVKITCTFCSKVLFCAKRSIDSCRSGHLRQCAIYAADSNKIIKKRALEPERIELVNDFNYQKRLKTANDDDYYYDVNDWEDVEEDVKEVIQSDLETKYKDLFGTIKPGNVPNGALYIFQTHLLSLIGKNVEKAPLRTGWIRTADDMVSSSSWEDYVLINRFYSKHWLSIAAGDELLELIRQIGMRHEFAINIPRTMRSIR